MGDRASGQRCPRSLGVSMRHWPSSLMILFCCGNGPFNILCKGKKLAVTVPRVGVPPCVRGILVLQKEGLWSSQSGSDTYLSLPSVQ